MSEVVLDSSVVLKWFRSRGERHLDAARALRDRFESGDLHVVVPPLSYLEVLNIAARKWGWDEARLDRTAAALSELRFEAVLPEIRSVARWASHGLTAYDASYVAVADRVGVPLITDDSELVRLAPEIAVALVP